MDMVKVGMMLLYYRTEEGAYGQAALTENEWRFVAVTESDARQRIDALFESLQKQIRVGSFVLPNAGLARGDRQ